ncbi:hypothetical protein MMC21_003975 [Puttea exsequens]|nr:hypothetical protein [Puttea exsequens]
MSESAQSEDPKIPEPVWYDANCHCAAIKYRMKLPPLETLEVMSDNCSICTKNGYLNVYPKRSDIVFLRGEDHMKGYFYGNKEHEHFFCPTCGSSLLVGPHMDDPEAMAANVRMIKDVELDKLKYIYFDGRNKLGPPYNPD